MRMKTQTMKHIRLAGVAMMLVALAACSTGPVGPSASVSETAPAPGGALKSAPVEMAGRWTLASTAGGACSMNFRPATGVAEGAIAPEGGCPGAFFTSRKWTYEQTGLVIRDHTGKTLAQLAAAGPSRFEGRTAEGAGITLSR
jgi:hypothetical protein